jgi:hypothetical protein
LSSQLISTPDRAYKSALIMFYEQGNVGNLAELFTASASGIGFVPANTAYYRCDWDACVSGYTSSTPGSYSTAGKTRH